MRKKASSPGRLKNVATAQWDFAQLRKNGDFVYVDKTDMLAKLAMRDPDNPKFEKL